MGRPHKFIELDALERSFFSDFIRKGESRALEQNRARILLWSDSKVKAEEIATIISLKALKQPYNSCFIHSTTW